MHSILRRLDDDFCDPLELRGDSALGVPGLIGALRAGRVVVANALGTGVLESAAWLGFLPRDRRAPASARNCCCPRLPPGGCGEKPALEYVLANLDRLVIKPTYPNQRFEPMFGRDFEGEARDLLIERLRNRPYAYVAQEHVRLSQAPVWKSAASSELGTRALTIRVYAVVTPDGVRVMPGGLARVANEAAADVVSTQRGGGAKDIWVLERRILTRTRSRRCNPASGPTAAPGLTFLRGWSRTSTGWAATPCAAKTPRGCCCARSAARSDARVWAHARQICRDLGAVSAGAEIFDALRTRDSQGLQADVKHLAWCASQVRNRLSARYWRGVRRICSGRCRRRWPRAAAAARSTSACCCRSRRSTGFSEEDMMHDEGWRVMRLGRRIERMQFVASILMRSSTSPHAHPSRGRGMAARTSATARLSTARRYLGAPRLVADAEPAAVRRWPSHGAGLPSPFDRPRPR